MTDVLIELAEAARALVEEQDDRLARSPSALPGTTAEGLVRSLKVKLRNYQRVFVDRARERASIQQRIAACFPELCAIQVTHLMDTGRVISVLFQGIDPNGKVEDMHDEQLNDPREHPVAHEGMRTFPVLPVHDSVSLPLDPKLAAYSRASEPLLIGLAKREQRIVDRAQRLSDAALQHLRDNTPGDRSVDDLASCVNDAIMSLARAVAREIEEQADEQRKREPR